MTSIGAPCYTCSMNRIMDLAYIRDGKITHTDEAVILALLTHTRGKGRGTKDMDDVRRIMRDKNLTPRKKKNARN